MSSKAKNGLQKSALKDDSVFKQSIELFLEDMKLFLSSPKEVLIPSKLFVLKNIASTVPDLQLLFNPTDLGNLALGFMRALPMEHKKENLYLEELKLIRNFVSGPVGEQPQSLCIIMPTILDYLKTYLTNIENNSMTEPYICISILLELLRILQKSKDQVEIVWEYHRIIPELTLVVYRIQQHKFGETVLLEPSDEIIQFFKVNPLRDATMCFWTIFYVLTEEQIGKFLSGFDRSKIKSLLFKIMKICSNALCIKLFSDIWVVMLMVEHCLIFKLLKQISSVLQDSFSKELFDFELWHQFFELGVSLATSQVLKSTSSTKARQTFLKSNYGEIRSEIFEHIGKL